MEIRLAHNQEIPGSIPGHCNHPEGPIHQLYTGSVLSVSRPLTYMATFNPEQSPFINWLKGSTRTLDWCKPKKARAMRKRYAKPLRFTTRKPIIHEWL